MGEPEALAEGELWDLERLAEAQRLCDWMEAQFAPCIGPTVAEVGAGIGTFTQRLLSGGAERVLAIEPEPECADELERRFGSESRVRLSRDLLPGSPDLEAWHDSCDLVLCQNVLEHIEDDGGAVRAMAAALRPGGSLFLLVPAHPRLYGSLDRRFGHFRRYDRERVRDVIEAGGLVLDDLYSFNALGVPGWWVKSRTGDPSLDSRSLRAYETLVRFWRPVEERLRLRWGLSLIARARRPAA